MLFYNNTQNEVNSFYRPCLSQVDSLKYKCDCMKWVLNASWDPIAQTTFRGGIWPHFFSSVYAHVSWATLKDPTLRSSLIDFPPIDKALKDRPLSRRPSSEQVVWHLPS